MVTGAHRFSEAGDECALSEVVIEREGTTLTMFKTHGLMIQSLLVAQVALFLLYYCSVIILCQTATINSPQMIAKWKTYNTLNTE